MLDGATTLLTQMDRLGDIFVNVRAELAQTTLTFSELLDLEKGSIIQLARPTGENIDIYAEDVLIGWGEVLVTDGAMTVRIADLQNTLLPGVKEGEEGEDASSQEEPQ